MQIRIYWSIKQVKNKNLLIADLIEIKKSVEILIRQLKIKKLDCSERSIQIGQSSNCRTYCFNFTCKLSKNNNFSTGQSYKIKEDDSKLVSNVQINRQYTKKEENIQIGDKKNSKILDLFTKTDEKGFQFDSNDIKHLIYNNKDFKKYKIMNDKGSSNTNSKLENTHSHCNLFSGKHSKITACTCKNCLKTMFYINDHTKHGSANIRQCFSHSDSDLRYKEKYNIDNKIKKMSCIRDKDTDVVRDKEAFETNIDTDYNKFIENNTINREQMDESLSCNTNMYKKHENINYNYDNHVKNLNTYYDIHSCPRYFCDLRENYNIKSQTNKLSENFVNHNTKMQDLDNVDCKDRFSNAYYNNQNLSHHKSTDNMNKCFIDDNGTTEDNFYDKSNNIMRSEGIMKDRFIYRNTGEDYNNYEFRDTSDLKESFTDKPNQRNIDIGLFGKNYTNLPTYFDRQYMEMRKTNSKHTSKTKNAIHVNKIDTCLKYLNSQRIHNNKEEQMFQNHDIEERRISYYSIKQKNDNRSTSSYKNDRRLNAEQNINDTKIYHHNKPSQEIEDMFFHKSANEINKAIYINNYSALKIENYENEKSDTYFYMNLGKLFSFEHKKRIFEKAYLKLFTGYINYQSERMQSIMNLIFEMVPFTLITGYIYFLCYIKGIVWLNIGFEGFLLAFLACCSISSKFWDDLSFFNKELADKIGISIKKYNNMEVYILNKITYNLGLTKENIQAFINQENLLKLDVYDNNDPIYHCYPQRITNIKTNLHG